jgi:stalled ribosome rescue protein Dom34
MTVINDLRVGHAKTDSGKEVAVAHHFHAVVWIDHKQARIFHFSVDEADKTVIRPDHSVRDIRCGEKRTGHRIAEDRKYFEAVAQAIADAGAILILGPSEEKHELAKFIAEKHPTIKAHIEGVESSDHPTDGELLDHARRYVKAADRMRPQA